MLQGDIAALQYLKWGYKTAEEGLLTRAGDRRRGNTALRRRSAGLDKILGRNSGGW